MPVTSSLLDQLRTQYEATRQSTQVHDDVETFQQIDTRLRGTFRWLEKAVTYLDGLKPPIQHRFDLGHGLVFEAPRFGRGSVGQHTRRIVGFPVLDEINVYYEIVAAKELTIEVAPAGVALAHKTLDDARLTYTSRCFEDSDGLVRKCNISVPPAIPAVVSFRVDYDTGHVAVAMVNVDRIDRVTLDFESKAIDEPALEDLVRLILGQDAAFLRRAPLAGLHGRPAG
jgi:hypothetical protein